MVLREQKLFYAVANLHFGLRQFLLRSSQMAYPDIKKATANLHIPEMLKIFFVCYIIGINHIVCKKFFSDFQTCHGV